MGLLELIDTALVSCKLLCCELRLEEIINNKRGVEGIEPVSESLGELDEGECFILGADIGPSVDDVQTHKEDNHVVPPRESEEHTTMGIGHNLVNMKPLRPTLVPWVGDDLKSKANFFTPKKLTHFEGSHDWENLSEEAALGASLLCVVLMYDTIGELKAHNFTPHFHYYTLIKLMICLAYLGANAYIKGLIIEGEGSETLGNHLGAEKIDCKRVRELKHQEGAAGCDIQKWYSLRPIHALKFKTSPFKKGRMQQELMASFLEAQRIIPIPTNEFKKCQELRNNKQIKPQLETKTGKKSELIYFEQPIWEEDVTRLMSIKWSQTCCIGKVVLQASIHPKECPSNCPLIESYTTKIRLSSMCIKEHPYRTKRGGPVETHLCGDSENQWTCRLFQFEDYIACYNFSLEVMVIKATELELFIKLQGPSLNGKNRLFRPLMGPNIGIVTTKLWLQLTCRFLQIVECNMIYKSSQGSSIKRPTDLKLFSLQTGHLKPKCNKGLHSCIACSATNLCPNQLSFESYLSNKARWAKGESNDHM